MLKIVNAYIGALALGYKSLDLGYTENNIHFNAKEIIEKEIQKNNKIYKHLSENQKIIFKKHAVHKEYKKFGKWFKAIFNNTQIKEHFEKKILNDLIFFSFYKCYTVLFVQW